MDVPDANYLASPNEPLVSPHEFPMPTHGLSQQYPNQMMSQNQVYGDSQSQVYEEPYYPSSPVGVRLPRASPPPSSRRYAPYEAKPVMQMGSRRSSHQHPSPIATSIELPSRMSLQSPASPYASISSPGGSEGMFSSYQQSDPDVERRESQSQQSLGHIIPPPSPEDFSPGRILPEAVSPDPEGQAARRQVGPIRSTGRPGGRALGTHLEPKVAKAAHDMRKIVACWHCVLQRDKVSAALHSVRLN